MEYNSTMSGLRWKTLTLKVPEETYEQIEQYQIDKGLESVSAAARFLLSTGLTTKVNNAALQTIRDNAQAAAFHLVDRLIAELKEKFHDEYSD